MNFDFDAENHEDSASDGFGPREIVQEANDDHIRNLATADLEQVIQAELTFAEKLADSARTGLPEPDTINVVSPEVDHILFANGLSEMRRYLFLSS